MLKHLRGTMELGLRAASAEPFLNRMTAEGIPFWEFQRESELDFHCTVYRSDLEAVQMAASRSQCELRVLRERGLPKLLKRLRSRPVLTGGVLLAVGLTALLQNFVWFLRIEGNERISASEIENALYEEGVRFGAWGPGLESENLKNRMLNRIPALLWLAVNREGAVVTVLTAEREPETKTLESEGIANLVATRAGIIQELHVINGFAAVEPGDAVMPGDVLISGIMEWTNRVQATRAMGEVYAQTLHREELVCPAQVLKKTFTGRVEVCRNIIFQRKRRKISGNSSIFGTMCDRMIETTEYSMPGGWRLPIVLETVTLREYTLTDAELPSAAAESLLNAEALRTVTDQMIAGRTAGGRTAVQRELDRFLCKASFNCVELISRTVPAELYREEKQNGKTDQRGAN